MPILHQFLGAPYQDNALFVRLESGQATIRLLFDCGEKTISELPPGQVMKIDHLFFSHFHIDHVAGFDHFIRLNYNRVDKPVHIWGPEGATNSVFHRLNSVTWNLLENTKTQWLIHEVKDRQIEHSLISAKDQFRTIKKVSSEPFSTTILDWSRFSISVRILEHKIPVLAFKIVEKDREKVNAKKLRALNLQPGPWVKQLLDHSISDEQEIQPGDHLYKLGYLRKKLLYVAKGERLAYLTDFLIPPAQRQSLIEWLNEVNILYCESQYLDEDKELALKNYHLTVGQAARLADEANVQQLFIFHFSQRYKDLSPGIFLKAARMYYPQSFLPDKWAEIG